MEALVNDSKPQLTCYRLPWWIWLADRAWSETEDRRNQNQTAALGMKWPLPFEDWLDECDDEGEVGRGRDPRLH